MATIQRLDPYMEQLYHLLSRNIQCSDSFKNGRTHQFKGNITQCENLIYLGIKLGLTIEIIDTTTFNFSYPHMRLQNLFFKLCRYIRYSDQNETLKVMIDLIKNHNIKPFNAIYLAHLILPCNNQYSIVACSTQSIINRFHCFRSKNSFIRRITSTGGSSVHNIISYKYIENAITLVPCPTRREDERVKIMKAIKNKDYKKLQRLMYEPR